MLQWTDRHGTTHPVDKLGKNQCNLKAPKIFTDKGEILDKNLLPIHGFSYGPLRFKAESAKVTIGSLKCDPKPRNIRNESTVRPQATGPRSTRAPQIKGHHLTPSSRLTTNGKAQSRLVSVPIGVVQY